MGATITHYGQPVTPKQLRERVTRRATALQTELNGLRQEVQRDDLSAAAEASARVACRDLDSAVDALLRLSERLRVDAHTEDAHGPR